MYVANIARAISNGNLEFSKIKLPKDVKINDLKSHPTKAQMVAACSDGYVIFKIFF